jgi:hypothetical protein
VNELRKGNGICLGAQWAFAVVRKRRQRIKEKIAVPVVWLGKVGIGANARNGEGFRLVVVF